MRMLVDLLNNDHGYVRIFEDRDGFGYEVATYAPRPIADLFQRMNGYASMSDAFAAAQHQLSSVQQIRSRKSRVTRRAG
ncbi:MAG: hypothetical protein ACJ8OJ_00220 [Povalibacter sp.]|jgi:hypothetical protein